MSINWILMGTQGATYLPGGDSQLSELETYT